MRSWCARTRASSARTGVIRCMHCIAHALTARACFPTRSQDARSDARGGLGATASSARRRGGAAKTPRGRGRPRGSTKAAAAAATGRGDDGDDDDRAVYDRREVRSKATRHRSRVRFDRYRTIDRSVTGGGLYASRPFVNGRCVPRGGESPFRCGRSRWGVSAGSAPRARVGADAGSCDDDDACAS
jgi:hypothetical protein